MDSIKMVFIVTVLYTALQDTVYPVKLIVLLYNSLPVNDIQQEYSKVHLTALLRSSNGLH